MRQICMSGSMSGVWKRSHGQTSEAPPDERGGNRYVRPTATAPHSDSTNELPAEIRPKSPSPPFRGEREGPTPEAWEGEVGGAADRDVGPPPPPPPPPPAGGGGGLKWLSGKLGFRTLEKRFAHFSPAASPPA